MRQKTYKEFTRITEKTALKIIEQKGKFDGFIVGCNVNEYHFFEGWNLACKGEHDNQEDFKKWLNSWNYYNANNETGNYPAIYIINELLN